MIAVPPVRIARSSSIALRRSPYPGALTAQTFRTPRILLMTRVLSASPVTSSAMMMSGFFDSITFSRKGTNLVTESILSSKIRTSALLNSTDIASVSVTKFALKYPRSKRMPSTTSTIVSRPLPSSTVMTPSLPTFSKASAMIAPTSVSLFALIVATFSIPPSMLPTGFAIDTIVSVTEVTALRMPRTSALASAPAAINFSPLRKRASASTVAVVVPSPASSEVLEAASLTNLAPMFSILLRSSISSATVTPSLVTDGPPQLLSSTALRPRGPRVLFTAAASFSTPARSCLRAWVSNVRSLTAMVFSSCVFLIYLKFESESLSDLNLMTDACQHCQRLEQMPCHKLKGRQVR